MFQEELGFHVVVVVSKSGWSWHCLWHFGLKFGSSYSAQIHAIVGNFSSLCFFFWHGEES